MNDQEKTREQLIEELVELRQRISEEREAPQRTAAATLFQVAPLGIHECDSEGRITFVNPSHEALTGHTAEELVGTYVWDRIPPGPEKESLPAYFKQLVAEQPAPTPFFAKNVKKGGELFDVRVDWNYLRNAQGEVTGFVSIISDITEQKQAEQALRESEERFRRIFDQGPLGVTLVGLDLRIQRVNKRLGDMLGYSEDEVIRLGIRGISHPDDLQQDRQLVLRLLRGEIPYYTLEKRYLRKDGQVMWGELTVCLLCDAEGNPTHTIGMTEDITERKRAETELLESEERCRLLAEAIPHPVFRCGAEGGLIECNHRWYEYTGQTPDEARGNGWMKALHPDDLTRTAQRVREDVAGGDLYQTDYRLRRASDGSYRWHLARAIPRRDASGTITAWFGTAIDIDDRKRAEEDLARNKAILQATIESLPFDFFALGLDGVYTIQNTAFVSHWGQSVGKRPDDISQDKSTLSIWLDNNRRAFAGEKVEADVEFPVQGKSGCFHNIIAPIREGEQILGILGVNIDITDRKRAEEELQQANERLERRVQERTAELSKANELLRAEVEQRRQAEEKLAIFARFVESATQGFGMADVDGTVLYANPFLARFVGGQTPEDVKGKRLAGFYTPDYLLRRESEILPALRSRGHWQGEQMMIFPDGQLHPTLHSIFPVHDENGELLCTAAVITDITQLKAAEEALRQSYMALQASKERYELAVRGAGVGIWDWDIRTGELYFSPRWKALFGYADGDIGHRLEDWVRLLHPDEREWITKFLEDFLAGTSSIIAVEYRLRHKDGSYRWITAHAVVVRDEQGRAVRMVGSHGDITDRKLAEEIVKAEQQALRRMVLATDHERRLITYELHDGVAQQLLGAKMLFASQQPPKRRKSATADAHCDGMEALAQASAELRRVMNRLRTPVLDRFGLAEAIRDVASQLRSTPGAPEIDYSRDVQFERLEPTLENSLFRIAQEAMTNACRHSQSEKVRVRLTQEGDEVTLEVQDWGIGFDQDAVVENHFGLEGIRERSRLLGGKLSVKSEPGQGTVVRVTFPVIEAADPD